MATSNPVEYEGTYPLPEAQLDRFMVRLAVGYPSPAGEAAGAAPPAGPADGGDRVSAVVDPRDAAGACRPASRQVPVDPDIVRLLRRAGRQHPQPSGGGGGSLAARFAGPAAGRRGRWPCWPAASFVTPEDVKQIAVECAGPPDHPEPAELGHGPDRRRAGPPAAEPGPRTGGDGESPVSGDDQRRVITPDVWGDDPRHPPVGSALPCGGTTPHTPRWVSLPCGGTTPHTPRWVSLAGARETRWHSGNPVKA